MPNQTKIQPDLFNLTTYNETEGLDLISSLTTLKVISEKIDKTLIVKDLEINYKLEEL